MSRNNEFFSTQFLTTTISTTLVLVLLGIIVLFVITARNLSTSVRENINVSVLISDDLSEKQIGELKTEFEQARYTKSVEYVSKEQALQEEIEAQGVDPTEFIDSNPYTASFEIKINADHANPDSMQMAVQELKGHRSVVDVIYSKDLIKAVNDNLSKASAILLVIAALFTYISFVLINNTVRLTIFAKRFSINTMKLVGASWGFIRRPFLKRSLALGIVSAIIADAILIAGIQWLHNFEPQIHTILGWRAFAIVSAAVFFFGPAICSVCTYISLDKYLRMSSRELYYV